MTPAKMSLAAAAKNIFCPADSSSSLKIVEAISKASSARCRGSWARSRKMFHTTPPWPAAGVLDMVASPGPVKVPEEVAFRIEEDEDVVRAALIPELPDQVLHGVGLARANPAEEQDVRLDQLLKGEAVRRRGLPAKLHSLKDGDRAVLGAGRRRVRVAVLRAGSLGAGRSHGAVGDGDVPLRIGHRAPRLEVDD